MFFTGCVSNTNLVSSTVASVPCSWLAGIAMARTPPNRRKSLVGKANDAGITRKSFKKSPRLCKTKCRSPKAAKSRSPKAGKAKSQKDETGANRGADYNTSRLLKRMGLSQLELHGTEDSDGNTAIADIEKVRNSLPSGARFPRTEVLRI